MHAEAVDVCEQASEHLAGELSAIHDAGSEIAWVERRHDARVCGYLDAVIRAGTDCARWMAQWQKGEPRVEGPWPQLPGCEAFGNELATLAATLCALLGRHDARLRIETTTRTTCPRFHVDNVPARLLYSWRGPGTDYLDGRCADRSRLGPGSGGLPDGNSGLILDSAGIRRIPTFAVAVLKGEQWPDLRSRGAIHRSPLMPPDAGPRAMVAIDTH
ncbi:DUF1826 domain-containing protein [Burkholderia multivorans]|uniref:DUF1826 domain-containing protein n=1 Tax=Burkholderia multivorans TaxID=87883 RepID=A0AB37AQP1_9BURK|nr:DUF1826 domain-containing protein [Burkholderia multivorans]PRE45431.1 hypothetical protein C6P99_19205 [Burkholderia multivorans]PRE52118.1 hypothetical protein C6P97_07420 [Burkholderia multivorans]